MKVDEKDFSLINILDKENLYSFRRRKVQVMNGGDFRLRVDFSIILLSDDVIFTKNEFFKM